MYRIILLIALAVQLCFPALLSAQVRLGTYDTQRSHRVLISVPSEAEARLGDERPADVVLDFGSLLVDESGRVPDLASLRLVRLDPKSGAPVVSVKNAYGMDEFDVPIRWYDDALGYDFQEFDSNINATEGKLNYRSVPRLGYFYDAIGTWRKGHLAFVHRETGKNARYAVLFNLLPKGSTPNAVPPRGFLGDGLNRCTPVGDSTTGLIHSRIDMADWNGDGLLDILLGCARGGILWYPNQGTKAKPSFPVSHHLFTQDGKPIDVGWSSSPKVVDWNGDGRVDLLTGGEWNRVLLYLNVGEAGAPVLEYAGLLRTEDGEPLTVPWEPSPETAAHYVYTKDYYPMLEVADWDHDGDMDLLAGGYVTGRIFFFENTAGDGKTPSLVFRGPLLSEGDPIDVGWAAAPSVYDIDGDGDLDLATGAMPMTVGGGDASSSEAFVTLFLNEGTSSDPQLKKAAFPLQGTFPNMALGTPRFVDWNSDGLVDMAVSADDDIFLYKNIGTAKAPLFEAAGDRLPSQWGRAGISATQYIDWNKDGLPDAVNAPFVRLNEGKGSPGIFGTAFSVLEAGQDLRHLSGIGDDWTYPRLFDLDQDGRIDYMEADHGGYFWWHRNRGSQESPDFEEAGIELQRDDGTPLQVGEGLEGFEALQGARPKYWVADVDQDSLPDLVATNTQGVVHYFRQRSAATAEDGPRFDPAIIVGKVNGRPAICAADWNRDGFVDLIVSSTPSNSVVFLGTPENSEKPFDDGTPLTLPAAPFGSGGPIVAVDFNSDGDLDLMSRTAYGYYCFYENSFIRDDYVRATVVQPGR